MTEHNSELRVKSEEVRVDRDSVAVVERDTIKETTTITYIVREAQEPNVAPDTVRISTVTDRLRARDRDAIAVQRTKTEVKVDTVYVEKRDSVLVSNTNSTKGTRDSWGNQLARVLKWIFWIIIALTGFVIVIKVFNILK